ncbi:MAG TPA: proton-conducting transporter membrane subunit, partial [Acidobacteriaceae bacterium]|nr:proton-conducting transporter membrane subunit [Acidobacteriaceae bacterium]
LRTVDDYQGLATRRPILSALLAFFLLSLIGIPFTGGFFGKFYVFTAALQSGHVWLAVIGLVNSGVACFYYLRLLSCIYAKPTPQPLALQADARAADHAVPGTPLAASFATGPNSASARTLAASPRIPASAALAILLTAAATLLLGILPAHILHLANSAASTLGVPAVKALATTAQPSPF